MYYNSLSDNEKRAYNQVLGCYENMDSILPLGIYNLTENELDKLIHMISKNHPEIFWIESNYSYSICQSTRLVQSFSPKYRMEKAKRNHMRDEIIISEKYFLDGIRFSMTAYEKALRLYENMPRLITYDYEPTVGERKERHKTKLDDCSTIYGALVLHKEVCGGL